MDLANWAVRTSPKFATGLKTSVPSGFLTRSEIRKSQSPFVPVNTYKTIILPVVLYGCETWSISLREEHRLRVFKNKVLRKIFGAKRDEITGEWRKLHNVELHALYLRLI